MSLPNSLSSLTVREAIIDSLYRCVTGLDTNDVALFDSAFTQDASFDLNGTVFDGLDAIHTGCYEPVSKLDTTHFLTNIRVDVKDGETKAAVTASALAEHWRAKQGTEPGAKSLTSGCFYNFDCIKDEKDGLWKITHWKLKLVWTRGDMEVITGA